jgi:hypothetical protein
VGYRREWRRKEKRTSQIKKTKIYRRYVKKRKYAEGEEERRKSKKYSPTLEAAGVAHTA